MRQAELGAAEVQIEGKKRFRIVAYTGAEVGIEGKTYVFNLAGMKTTKKRLPLLLDHEARKRAGVIEKVTSTGSSLVVEGHLIDSTWAGKEAIRSGGFGFPYEASMRPSWCAEDVRYHLGKAVINGRTYPGRIHEVKVWQLKEVSLVTFGADTKTQVEIAASETEDLADLKRQTVKLREKLAKAIREASLIEAAEVRLEKLEDALEAYPAKVQAIRQSECAGVSYAWHLAQERYPGLFDAYSAASKRR